MFLFRSTFRQKSLNNFKIEHNFVRMSAHEKKIPQFMIAAPHSSSGKTTVSIGLMEELTLRGLKVQPFKCGPDYIDTKFHLRSCNRPSYNLDSYFATAEHLRNIYAKHSQDADICIVEGMMGLFDGYSRSKGSAAEIAAILGIPVILTVDAQSTAYSLAPLLKGFRDFSSDITVKGVIFNKVGSLKHRQMLEEVCQDVGLEAIGFIPKSKEAENASRYLGLDFSQPAGKAAASSLISGNVDLGRLLEMTTCELKEPIPSKPEDGNRPKVLVARNSESFSFIYQEHLDGWRNIRFFNPEEDLDIPSEADLLYLPGGYPEKHLEALAKCGKTMSSIKRFAQNGGKIIAECGGMMYLCKSIAADEKEWPMCGVLPYSITARSKDRKLCLGYRSFSYNGLDFRGHEFHYTNYMGKVPESMVQVFDAKGNKVSTPIVRLNNTIASYTHLYWGEQDIFRIF